MEFTKLGVLRNKVAQIGGAAVAQSRDLETWETSTAFFAAPGVFENQSGWSHMRLGEHWRLANAQTRWFRTQFTLPEEWRGRCVYLELDLGGEGLVRLNGRIISAVTSFLPQGYSTHRRQRERVLVTQNAQGGEAFTAEIECAMNYMEFAEYRARGAADMEYTLRKAKLILLDDAAEQFFFDAQVLLETVEALESPYDKMRRGSVKLPPELASFLAQSAKDPLPHGQLLAVLQRSLAAVDVDFDRETLLRSLPEAQRLLTEGLAAVRLAHPGRITAVGHAHIDSAWWWPLKESVRKAAKTFANALSLMEQYPGHVFAHSQPWQYAEIKEHYPELFEKIKRRVEEGRWELLGNSWVEADANIPSGEALVRQLLYGRNFFLKEFGKASDVYWMPDVFGYSWALPQIILRSGMKYFYTAKLLNNDVNRFPYSLFLWQGADGSRVPAYLQRVSYNSEMTPKMSQELWREFDEKDRCPAMLQTFGFGDGGGGPTYQMLEYAKRMENMPGLPQTKVARTSEFFAQLPPQDELPLWNDEMYYEFHRGTYTSQARAKRANRKGELALRQAEIFCAAALRLLGAPYPMEELTQAWKLLLRAQFHDIIPGSSIGEVYEDAARDYTRMFELCGAAQDTALRALSEAFGAADGVTVWNSLGWTRTGRIHWKGREIAVEAVPAMGCRVLSAEALDNLCAEAPPVPAEKTALENEVLRVELDEAALITRIFDKVNGREVLEPGAAGNLLTVFEDKPERESAWNIDLEYKNKFWELREAQSVEAIPHGLRVVRRFHRSLITQEILLFPGSRQLEFRTVADWHEKEKMLKAAFPVDILSPRASYEIAYGAIERPTHTNTSWDAARFELPAQKWADLSEGNYGVALLNDCKYGYDIRHNVLRLTLLRSPVYPDPDADQGEHCFDYALLPHAGGWREANLPRAGCEFNVPLALCNAAGAAREISRAPWIQCSAPQIILEALKQSEDGEALVLRAYEAQGGRCKAKFSLGFAAKAVRESNLMEEPEQPDVLENGSFAAEFHPFEIKTFRIA
ncbi:MAG: alpha-mannosidase [Oscillospiraceae bacterium]|jgi:alpha-mannosidase|nr:alpha-mannosidase [Oscillospiraceae bacterium]